MVHDARRAINALGVWPQSEAKGPARAAREEIRTHDGAVPDRAGQGPPMDQVFGNFQSVEDVRGRGVAELEVIRHRLNRQSARRTQGEESKVIPNKSRQIAASLVIQMRA